MTHVERFELKGGRPNQREFSEEDKAERKWFVSYLRELIEKVESGELKPAGDWDTIWVVSGTEDDPYGEAEGKNKNQARERIEKGLELIKEVTAIRTGKSVAELSTEDIESQGPQLFFNGSTQQDVFLKSYIDSGFIFNTYGIPPSKISIAEKDGARVTTREQFDTFPEDILAHARKIAVVSSLYHCPRLAKYIEKKARQEERSELREQMVVYPADIEVLRTGRAVGEGKKILDYFEGILMHKNIKKEEE